jgi:hypothetical protein
VLRRCRSCTDPGGDRARSSTSDRLTTAQAGGAEGRRPPAPGRRAGGVDLGPDLGLEAPISAAAGPSSRPLEIASSRMGCLWDGLSSAYDALGFTRAAGDDEVFRQLVLARIIEPTSKADSLRVLAVVGVDAVLYPTLNRRLRGVGRTRRRPRQRPGRDRAGRGRVGDAVTRNDSPPNEP